MNAPILFARVHYMVHATVVLREQARILAQEPLLLAAEGQDAVEWPRVERLLRRRAVPQAEVDGRNWYLLGYRDLQAITGLLPEAVICPVDWKQSAAGGAHAEGCNKGAANVIHARRSQNRAGRRQGGHQPVRIWAPWPPPAREHIARARRLLHLLYEEVNDDAREVAPVGWHYGRLAVRQEMGQLDVARRWEQLTLPRLLLALDVSGSMGGFIGEVLGLGATLAEVLPWLVVVAAPNAELEPLIYNDPGKFLIANGRWEPDPGFAVLPRSEASTSEWTLHIWRQMAQRYQIAGAIYIGDWEDEGIMPAFAGRRGVISVYRCREIGPTRTDRHYDRDTEWPTIIGCGSVERFLDGIEMLIRDWRTS